MKVEERNNMKIITADKGKLLKNTQTEATTNRIYTPIGADLSMYEEIYKNEDTKDIYEELDFLNGADIDIQLALIELYDIFTMMLGGDE